MPPRSARALRRFAAACSVLVACLIPVAAAHATGTIIDQHGSFPGIAVDSAGTGHVAYATDVVSGNTHTYKVSYCRLAKAATTCNKTASFPTPGNAVPFDRAQVLVDGSRVIVLQFVLGAPTGVYAWISLDGGNSFSAGTTPKKIAGEIHIDHAVLFGPGSNTVAIVDSVSSGVKFVAGDLTGANPGVPFRIGDEPGGGVQADAYTDVGMLNAVTPYVVESDGSAIYLKVFDSTKTGYNTAANWKPATLVGAPGEHISYPNTAFGPSGAFVAYQTFEYKNGGYPLTMRRINDDGTIGPPLELTPDGENAIQADLIQDDAGRLSLVYLDNGHANTLKYVWSKRGVSFSDPITIGDPDEDARDAQIATGPDGSGWVVTDSANYNTPIRVFALAAKGDADPAPSPKTTPLPPGATPGPPPAPTPTPVPCPAQIPVASGVVAMVRSGDCFKSADKGKTYKTTGSVRVNGVDFSAPASGTFTVDTVGHTVTAVGAYKILAGSIALGQGGPKTTATWTATGTNTIDDLAGFGVKLFGFGVVGKADVTFEPTGAAISINVQLPYPADAVRGQTTLHTTMAGGLKTTDLHITASTVPIGPLELRNLDVSYTGANDALEGHAEVYLPPAAKSAITAGFGFKGGSFEHAEFEVGPPTFVPLPLWAAPPVLLDRVGFSASVKDGFTLAGGVNIVAGASIAGFSPVSIDALPSSGGGASLHIPKGGNSAQLKASGKIRVLDIPVAYGSLGLDTIGPKVTFAGGTSLDLFVTSAHLAFAGGINLGNGDFSASGLAQACLNLKVIVGCGKLEAILSSIGIAACGTVEGSVPATGLSASYDLGYGRKWGGSSELGDCHMGDYQPASLKGSGARAHGARAGASAARLQAAGPQAITLGGGEKRDVRVKGNGTLPGFTFAGPGGRTVTFPAGSTAPALGQDLAAVPVSADTIEIQVRQPAGAWTLTPEAGSTIAGVTTAEQLPTPKVTAKVAKSKGGRTLSVKTKNLGTQHLMVREVLPGGGAHELGTVTGNGTKVIRFTPADDAAGRRAIQAIVVTKGGRQVASPQIGSYAAPGPSKPAAPRTVTLKRTKTAVTVKWKKVAGVSHYRVKVTANDGRLQIITVDGKSTRATVLGVTTDDNVQIKVSAVSNSGLEGAARAATSKPTKKAAAKKTTAKKKASTKR